MHCEHCRTFDACTKTGCIARHTPKARPDNAEPSAEAKEAGKKLVGVLVIMHGMGIHADRLHEAENEAAIALDRFRAAGVREERPAKFLAWAVEMFGPVALEPRERTLRFVEEAI